MALCLGASVSAFCTPGGGLRPPPAPSSIRSRQKKKVRKIKHPDNNPRRNVGADGYVGRVLFDPVGAAMTAIPTASSIPRPLDSSRLVTWVRDYWISAAAAAVLVWIVVIPLVYLIIFSFRSGTAAAPGDWTLANYIFVYTSHLTYEALGNTLIYTTAVATISMAIAGGLAWLVERTDMPYRGAAWVMILLPIAMPGMLSSMAWILLLGPRTGLINVVLRWFLAPFGYDAPSGPINIYSLEGMIFVESVRGSTTLFLMLVAGFRLMDPALEEAASMSGARNSYTLRKITLPLMLPLLLATWMYSFIGTLDDFETPLLIGLPAQIFLLPTVIYFTAYLSSAWGLAAAYATIFLLISVFMVVLYHRVVLRRTGQFATVTGKAFRPRQIELRRMRWPALALVIVYFFLAVVLPLLILLLASLLPFYRVPSLEMFNDLTLANYERLFSETRVLRAAGNSLWVSFWVASGTMILAFLLAWVIVRQRVPGRIILDLDRVHPARHSGSGRGRRHDHVLPVTSVALDGPLRRFRRALAGAGDAVHRFREPNLERGDDPDRRRAGGSRLCQRREESTRARKNPVSIASANVRRRMDIRGGECLSQPERIAAPVDAAKRVDLRHALRLLGASGGLLDGGDTRGGARCRASRTHHTSQTDDRAGLLWH